MKFNRKFFVIGALLCALAFRSFAQYGYGGFGSYQHSQYLAYLDFLKYKKYKEEGRNLIRWWRGESTLGIVMSTPATYTQRRQFDGTFYNAPSIDTTIKGNAQPEVGLHLNSNSNHMLARLGSGSILSFSWGFQFDFLRWKMEEFNGSEAGTKSTELQYWQFGLPLTIDYKWGSDVDFQPEMKTCFTVGAGAMPIFGTGFDQGGNNAGNSVRIAPYIYASFGVYLWGCWKIRASYMPGKFDIITDSKENYGSAINTMNIKGNHILTIGIAHMSRSSDWKDGGGWRETHSRYGTKNRYRKHSSGMRRMF